MKNNNKKSYWEYLIIGSQFTVMVLSPFGICLYAGYYFKEKFGWPDTAMGIAILIALLWVIIDFVLFIRLLYKKSNKLKRSESIETAKNKQDSHK